MLSTKCKQNVQTTSNPLAGVWMYGVGKVVEGEENKNYNKDNIQKPN